MVILALLFLLLPFAAAQWQSCGNSRNFTSNSTYQANLMFLSSTLPNKAASNATLFATDTVGDVPDMIYALELCRGDSKAASNATLFATDTVGDVPDMIYALELCRGDSNAAACKDCVATAFRDGQQLCPYSKDATIFYDPCMLRFSNQNFLKATVNDFPLILLNNTRAGSIKLLVFSILSGTAQSAAYNGIGFITSRIDVSSFPTLYSLMQCTPDLTAEGCAACFQDALQITLKYFDGPGGRVLGTRCSMRYEMYPFFQGEPMLPLTNLAPQVPAINKTAPGSTPVTVYGAPSVPPEAGVPPTGPEVQTTVGQHGGNSNKKVLWIISVAAPLLSILLCLIGAIVWMRRRRKGKVNLHNQAATTRLEEDALVWRLEEKSSEFTLFDFPEILRATCNFSKENLLGRGGFGPVYKGQLPDGMEIAVKRLASHSGQGFKELKNEVELIAKLQHNNLVKLMECCIEGEEKLLVYEYLPNKSLDFFIFDGNPKTLIDWNKRSVVIEGIAQGLLYLHKHSRLRIIHSDLKASNILLDQDMNPKISDFGLAKIFSSDDTQGSTKRVVGTYGYMSPEYASEGIYSIKSDVFSFGVLLLEILSGKRNSGFHQYGDFLNLLGYSWQLWEAGIWIELLETSIAKEIHTNEARRYINIALMCVQECADDRPTMSDVVAMLNNESFVLPEPNHPAYFNLRVSKVHESGSVVVPCSNNDVTITAEPDGR